jgi:hypothetical protein
MVYGSTYLMANSIDTAISTTKSKAPSNVTAGPTKFAATSLVNVSNSVFKDQCFTRLFGPAVTVPRAVPPATYALFVFRDALTIFASFNLPALVAPILPMAEGMERVVSRASAAQFIAPAALQLFSTPVHLLGLDLYNRNGEKVSWSSRWSQVKKNWWMSSLARMCRIVPAFGIGGVVNTKVRKCLMSDIENI